MQQIRAELKRVDALHAEARALDGDPAAARP
jgi:hypothetical protein